jgi:hypothetical protein
MMIFIEFLTNPDLFIIFFPINFFSWIFLAFEHKVNKFHTYKSREEEHLKLYEQSSYHCYLLSVELKW